MPKTGGTWARKVAQTIHGHRAVTQMRTTHAPMWRVAGRAAGSHATWIGTTRAPGDYYCSLWLHAVNTHNGPMRDALMCYSGGDDTPSFEDFLWGVTHPDETVVPPYVGVLTKPSNTPPECFEAAPFGLWTWMHRYQYGERDAHRDGHGGYYPEAWIADKLIDTTQGVRAWSEYWAQQVEIPAVNTRARYTRIVDERPYREWYGDEMISWVEESDGDLCRRMGRADIFSPATSAVIDTADLVGASREAV